MEQLIAAEKTSSAEPAAAQAEEDQKASDWARQRLNGHAAQLLKPTASGQGISGIRTALAGTRLIIAALNRAALETATIEALRRAEQLSPTENGMH